LTLRGIFRQPFDGEPLLGGQSGARGFAGMDGAVVEHQDDRFVLPSRAWPVDRVAGPGRIGSAELDLAAPGQRDREANRRAHLEIAAQRGAEKGGFAWPHGSSPWAERPTAAAHAEGPAGRRCGRQAQAGDITLLFRRRIGSPHPSLSRPRLGQTRLRFARRGAGAVQEAGDDRRP